MIDVTSVNATAEFIEKFGVFINAANKKVVDNYKEHFKNLTPGYLEFEDGRRYVRVVICNPHRSVFCFVDKTNGDVLKAASWSVPAKHARGNIFNPDNGVNAINAYGANYLL